MADGELQVAIVPDEQALENIEEKQLEISGEPDSVGEAKELNESQDKKLGIMSRKLGRIGSRLGQVAVIVTLLSALAKIMGEVFNIGFEDVRDAIVQAINLMVDAVKSFFPGGNRTSAPTSEEISGSVVPGLLTGGPGVALGNLLASRITGINEDRNSDSSSDSNGNINLFTSRDMISGDSTQQEMSSQNTQDFILTGGS